MFKTLSILRAIDIRLRLVELNKLRKLYIPPSFNSAIHNGNLPVFFPISLYLLPFLGLPSASVPNLSLATEHIKKTPCAGHYGCLLQPGLIAGCIQPLLILSDGKRLWRYYWLLSQFGYVAFSAILRYGYFGDTRLALGPSSSRLVEAGSVFVKQIEVKDYFNSDVLVYAFDEKPELTVLANWSASNFLVVAAYSRKGFSLWLNKGSSIRMRWEAPTRYLNQLEGVVIKGETKFKRVQPKQTFLNAVADPEIIYGKEAEYLIEEDDRYHIGVLNMNGRNIILTVHVNVSAMVYDTSKAKKLCSTANGLCRLRLLFPHTHYLTLMTTNNGVLGDWSVEVSFVARALTYIALLGFIVAVIFLILRYLGVCGDDRDQSTNVTTVTYRTSTVATSSGVTETEPLMPVKTMTYGTNEKDDDDNESIASSTSSEELYDEKLCVICYDELRNCFFIPCGHCATCYDCAQRIMDGDSKVCPICRRLIHKPRRLFHS